MDGVVEELLRGSGDIQENVDEKGGWSHLSLPSMLELRLAWIRLPAASKRINGMIGLNAREFCIMSSVG